MGNRNRRIYYESVLANKPMPWIAPPARIIAGDVIETIGNAAFALGGTWLIFGGIQYFTTHSIDLNACLAAGGIAAGAIMIMPVIGDTLTDFISDIRTGWELGKPPELESRPENPDIDDVIDNESEAIRTKGTWRYHNLAGELRFYHTPIYPAKGNETAKPIISDRRMIAIFSEVARGTPFSERRIRAKVPSLSVDQFRRLQDDWTRKDRQLYVLRANHSGYFTESGKIISNAIRTCEL